MRYHVEGRDMDTGPVLIVRYPSYCHHSMKVVVFDCLLCHPLCLGGLENEDGSCFPLEICSPLGTEGCAESSNREASKAIASNELKVAAAGLKSRNRMPRTTDMGNCGVVSPGKLSGVLDAESQDQGVWRESRERYQKR